MLIPFASVYVESGARVALGTVLPRRCRPSRIVVAPSDAWPGLVVVGVTWRKFPVFPTTPVQRLPWPDGGEVPFEMFTSGHERFHLSLPLPTLEAGSEVAVHVAHISGGSGQYVRLCMEGRAVKEDRP